jgi:group I intron endonuclease
MNGIYAIRNNINNKVYIGSTADRYGFKARWKSHRTALRSNKHHNDYLQKSWNKYGEGAFTFEIIEECSKKDCLEREQHYLDTIKPEYNICKIAGNTLGRKHSPETKIKISQNRQYGEPWNKGKTMSKDARLNMSKSQKASSKSKKHRSKLSNSRKKPVIGIHIETGQIIELSHINERKGEFFASGIKASILGKSKSYKKYIWKFKQ